jgi:hypothetical protein
MKLTQKQIWLLVGIGGVLVTTLITLLIIKRKRKSNPKITKKMSEIIVKGEYVVPKGTPSMGDALHSFERRKSDGFGGRMSTKIKEALMNMYNQGVNPDVTDLKIDVDSKNYKVVWEAKVQPSQDGKAYIGFTTVGSTGASADSRALGQVEPMKKRVGGEDYGLVLDFKNPKGNYIRQYFYKYTKPSEFPPHK